MFNTNDSSLIVDINKQARKFIKDFKMATTIILLGTA